MCLVDERSDLEGLYAVSRSVRWRGASRLRHLKVIKRILKRMRTVMGSQCNSFRIGVMCPCFRVPVRSRAAEF